ncbi:MAG: hypothetical protein QM680_04440 [Luteolibacter sp.]
MQRDPAWQVSRFMGMAKANASLSYETSMKTKSILPILSFAASPLLCAGTPELTPAAKSEYWITPTINVRARFESADIDGSDVSNALTTRERVGLKTAAWNGFSAVVEGEFTQAIVDDYSGGPSAADVDPYVANNSGIFDPENNSLNQLYGQYKGYDTVVKLGRQQIIYDNAAFIGNVGWRQNEQTFDGVSFVNTSIDGLTLKGAYINQINRIFGDQAAGVFRNAPGDIFLLNGSYTGIENVTLGAYAYLMDFDANSDNGAADKWDNNTFGVSASTKALGLLFYGEAAYQEHAGNLDDRDVFYEHVNVTKKFGEQSLTLGVENLGAGFQTPLATMHAFNGFADVFITGRTDGSHNGLMETYLTYTLPIFYGIKWSNTLRAMGDNTISTGYGYEFDSTLTKKFDDHFTAIATFAHFESEGDVYVGKAGLPTTQRVTLELNYSF